MTILLSLSAENIDIAYSCQRFQLTWHFNVHCLLCFFFISSVPGLRSLSYCTYSIHTLMATRRYCQLHLRIKSRWRIDTLLKVALVFVGTIQWSFCGIFHRTHPLDYRDILTEACLIFTLIHFNPLYLRHVSNDNKHLKEAYKFNS